MADDRSAEFEAVYRREAPRVLAYALRRTDRASANDVLSETFLIAWRRGDEMPAPALPWLLGVARRVLAIHARSQRRREALERVLVDQARESAPQAQPIDEDLLRALAALAPTDREALMLIGWDGLTPAEGAEVVGCSAGTFRVRVFRARRRLAAELRGVLDPTTVPLTEPRT